VELSGIGRNLVKQAVGHDNNVVAIDKDEFKCSEILEHFDILAITGNATDKTTLEEADIEHTDAFVGHNGRRRSQPHDLLAGKSRPCAEQSCDR